MQEKTVLDAEDMRRTLVRISHEIVERTGGHDVAIVGIHRRGAVLAARLHELVDALVPQDVPLGDVDISFYRDDVALRRPDSQPVVHSSHLDFPVEEHTIVLVDDVLYTGRTIRAAINELYDFGRPASVVLAVLVDRGGRELPIEAACAVARVSLPASERIELARDEAGRFTFEIR
jgi:pyrimidine operon attenuation protein / uracil phosphoribosyltransferase